MNAKTRALLAVTAASLAMTACLLPPPGGVVLVRTPPPRIVRVEAVGVAPGPGYIWIGGYWQWGGAEYVWVPGYWTLPPRGYRHWAPGGWVHRGHGWYWREGRWRK